MSQANDITTIDLLRHGACQDGAIFRGHTDSALSAHGEQQMFNALEKLRALNLEQENPWQTIVSSPLQRCANIAADLTTAQHPLILEPGFREISFGDWDGQQTEQVLAEQPQQVAAFWQDPSRHTPPHGESLQDFEIRVGRAWAVLLQNQRGNHVLLICHGGVVRMLLAKLLGMPLHALTRLSVPYGCISRITVHHKQGCDDWPQLVFHNA
jgi:broad specificity phosphatase PhoE